ncbi:hypothetical protein ENUP19_0156G0016 [Entamoeba nuttalli]|uniref:Proteasome assembly chaperone 3 n=2 Tax=Entamoeba nuttalli TaxID=412467 RepID=K2GS08_ENTNP|nr:hypothetical protein ENU1_187440 [Entamoeba nuttalli P19]EKE37753.1 hypothetical protein ENU1_187440 [Entamoeba nuttalli P19]|eukprot:XP_008859911.1 hypothetical protein ENU1_187440 [Entamoeba nuttalli P19]
MEVKYQQIKHLNKKYLIQMIILEKEIIVVIQYKNSNELNGLSLSQKTVEQLPSTTQLYGDVLDSDSQSLSQLFSMKLKKRVTVSCNVTFDMFDDSKAFVSSQILQFLS